MSSWWQGAMSPSRPAFLKNNSSLEIERLFTQSRLACRLVRALSSAVEHYLHTVGVAGSKPAARTIPSYELHHRKLDRLLEVNSIRDSIGSFQRRSFFLCSA